MARDCFYVAGFDAIIEPWGYTHLQNLAGHEDAGNPNPLGHVYLLIELGGEVGSMGVTETPFLGFPTASAAWEFIGKRHPTMPRAWLLYSLTKERCATWTTGYSQFNEAMKAWHNGTLVAKIKRDYAAIMGA